MKTLATLGMQKGKKGQNMDLAFGVVVFYVGEKQVSA